MREAQTANYKRARERTSQGRNHRLLTNAKKQPLDQSTRNTCGLLVVLRQEEKGENWPGESAMWPQMRS
ncbi:hypothetical protein LHV13_08640 [Ferrovum sp. PN-J185]|uniref:hypothetical protein n=1 Tax=Ferrovum sp. PN-J185 TaxID=1356306 RepID=UPI00083224E7|nr:hypothetical protein [Ferrovum sp. PN-J185]MCC6069235.1 hypothetical protein [Ferrovum sp. PN-J185]